jgi:UDP-N-acetylglucosamine 1-carboxyvinyltransferase
MPTYTISGGTSLNGSVRVGGAKNASFKQMIAALLGDAPSRLLNFSHISDVQMVASIINELGGVAREIGERAYLIDARGLSQSRIPAQYGAASRASTLFLPALLVRFGQAQVPLPGGDKIGVRSLDAHFAGLEAFGVQTRIEANTLLAEAPQLHAATYRFPKNTHTGTETLVMLAARIPGTSRLENAAEETEIDDLITCLNAMGARITRHPNRVIEIQGVAKLGGAIHKVMSDQNQVVSYACAALATRGDVVVENATFKIRRNGLD